MEAALFVTYCVKRFLVPSISTDCPFFVKVTMLATDPVEVQFTTKTVCCKRYLALLIEGEAEMKCNQYSEILYYHNPKRLTIKSIRIYSDTELQ